MTRIVSERKLTADIRNSVAAVCASAIVPVLRQCAETLYGQDQQILSHQIGFMAGQALTVRSEIKLNSLDILKGMGEAYGAYLRQQDQNALSGAVSAEYFIEGLEKGLGQKLTPSSGSVSQ